ncbi:MAG: hypothetical protein HC936_07400 [Leptolyngbyaceae cyanobacterium SU_3_3]|nr:hypothetical protein [Leptolyngbyaceae cyanobacterium SU_3_3]
MRVVVNSDQDSVQADSNLTLREAIELTNGTLLLDQLSEVERSQVSRIDTSTSEIAFRLPATQTIIRVGRELPAIVAPVTIDGTTQTGYTNTPVIAELPLAPPIIEITPTQNTFVARGLTVTADNVTIRGLSLHGFNDDVDDTARSPAADIFISHRLPPPRHPQTPHPSQLLALLQRRHTTAKRADRKQLVGHSPRSECAA